MVQTFNFGSLSDDSLDLNALFTTWSFIHFAMGLGAAAAAILLDKYTSLSFFGLTLVSVSLFILWELLEWTMDQNNILPGFSRECWENRYTDVIVNLFGFTLLFCVYVTNDTDYALLE